MKVVGFLLALGIVSTNALSKSAKSSSRSGSGKSGKAEVLDAVSIFFFNYNYMPCDNDNRYQQLISFIYQHISMIISWPNLVRVHLDRVQERVARPPS